MTVVKAKRVRTINAPVKVTILVGDSKGKSYILTAPDDVVRCGFSQGRVNGVIVGVHKSHRNCVFTIATEEEIKTLSSEVDKSAFSSLLKINGNTKYRITGTCRLTGKVISHIGLWPFDKLGFSMEGIKAVLDGKYKSHARHTWVKTPL